MLTSVGGTAWHQYGNANRLVTGEHKEGIGGNKKETVMGNDDKYVDQDQGLTVNRLQDVLVGEGQTIKILRGNREVTVGSGDLVETVNGNETRSITKDTKWSLNGKSNWVKLGDFDFVNGSIENGVTIGEKAGVYLGGKVEVDMGLMEKLNVGGIAEQTFSLKRTSNYGANLENNRAVVVSKAPMNSIDVDASVSMKTALKRDDAKAQIGKSKMAKLASKCILWG